MKRFVEGIDRAQSTLFPECLEDWIPFVSLTFVEELNLAELGFSGIDPEGYVPSFVSPVGAVEALHLRLSQSGPIEPPAGTCSVAQR
jgi:hypothetical protein